MKSFEEFLITADIEEVIQQAKTAAKRNESPEVAMISANTTITLSFLRKYHEWLAGQLDEPQS